MSSRVGADGFWKCTVVSVLCWASMAVCSQGLAAPVSTALDFRYALEHNDFSGIEERYAAHKAEGRRNARGEYLADANAAYLKVPYCQSVDWTVAKDVQKPARTDISACWEGAEARLNLWRKAYPSSTLVAVLLADLQVRKWKVQGSEDARSDDSLLDKARQYVDRIPAAQRDAVWYAQAMQIASTQGMGSKRFHRLFAEAAARYPDHAQVFRQAVFHYLPSNGGSIADIQALALEASRSAADGPMMYAYVYDDVAFGHGRLWQDVLLKAGLSWPQARAGWDAIYRLYPDPWNLNRFAQHACLAFDMPTLVRLLRLVDEHAQATEDDGWMVGELQRCRALAARQPMQPSSDVRQAATDSRPLS